MPKLIVKTQSLYFLSQSSKLQQDLKIDKQ